MILTSTNHQAPFDLRAWMVQDEWQRPSGDPIWRGIKVLW